MEGTKKAERCAQHAMDGMVNVLYKRCGHPGCTTRPSNGVRGETPEFCLQHAEQGIVVSRTGRPANSEGGRSGSGEVHADAPGSSRPATKKRARAPSVSVAVKAEERRDGVTGSSSSATTGTGKRARPIGFTRSVPVAVIREEACTKQVAIPTERSPSTPESQLEPVAAAETEVAVSTYCSKGVETS